jgi:histo-blood group ABO system transferase
MLKKMVLFLCFFIPYIFSANETPPPQKYKIALCTVATGKYSKYAERMIDSARLYFCTNHDVKYFIFTDQEIQPAANLIKVYKKREGWPGDSLKRFHAYLASKDLLKEFDYIFAVDADMMFKGPVGDEIFGDIVGTQHPGFIGKRGSYEKKQSSTAYVGPSEGTHYVAGAFYGGKRESFFYLIEQAVKKVDADLAKDYIAKWQDESYLNRVFADLTPAKYKILSSSYCYPESWNLDMPRLIVALDKNHEELRK